MNGPLIAKLIYDERSQRIVVEYPGEGGMCIAEYTPKVPMTDELMHEFQRAVLNSLTGLANPVPVTLQCKSDFQEDLIAWARSRSFEVRKRINNETFYTWRFNNRGVVGEWKAGLLDQLINDIITTETS